MRSDEPAIGGAYELGFDIFEEIATTDLFGNECADGHRFIDERRVAKEVHEHPILIGAEETGFGPIGFDRVDNRTGKPLARECGIGRMRDEIIAECDLEEAAVVEP